MKLLYEAPEVLFSKLEPQGMIAGSDVNASFFFEINDWEDADENPLFHLD